MSSICTGTKRDGSSCTLPSNESSGLCWAHDPANAERRRRGQSRGGRNKPSRELQTIKQRLSDLADAVLEGSVDKGVGAVASQIYNVYLRAVELERKVRETEEITQRLDELEALLARPDQGGRRWG